MANNIQNINTCCDDAASNAVNDANFDTATIEQSALNTICNRNLLDNKTHLMLMVSGGVDSVSLAYTISALSKDSKIKVEQNHIAIMHLDHMIRGEESAQDADFVSRLANFLGLNLYYYKEDVLSIAKENNDNLESTARAIRYRCVVDACKKFAEEQNVNLSDIAICTAHNADDRIENFYMRSIVGTGPGGLASLDYKSDYVPEFNQNNDDTVNLTIIRPLLDITKSDLKKYVDNLNEVYVGNSSEKWREDSTNEDTSKFRAFVRKNILPLSKSYNKNFENNLCNTMNLIADENDFLEKIAKTAERDFVDYKNIDGDNFTIVDPNFSTLDIVIQRRVAYRILRKMLPDEARINTSSVASIIKCAITHNYTENIQGDLIIHSNKKGMTIETSNLYRHQRKRL